MRRKRKEEEEEKINFSQRKNIESFLDPCPLVRRTNSIEQREYGHCLAKEVPIPASSTSTTTAAVTTSVTIIIIIMIIHRPCPWRLISLRTGACTYEEWAKAPVKAIREEDPRDLIEANWPANPVRRLIKTRAVVLSFVSPFNGPGISQPPRPSSWPFLLDLPFFGSRLTFCSVSRTFSSRLPLKLEARLATNLPMFDHRSIETSHFPDLSTIQTDVTWQKMIHLACLVFFLKAWSISSLTVKYFFSSEMVLQRVEDCGYFFFFFFFFFLSDSHTILFHLNAILSILLIM